MKSELLYAQNFESNEEFIKALEEYIRPLREIICMLN